MFYRYNVLIKELVYFGNWKGRAQKNLVGFQTINDEYKAWDPSW